MAEMTIPQSGEAATTIPTADAAAAGIGDSMTPEKRMEIVRKIEQAMTAAASAPGEDPNFDAIIMEAGQLQGKAPEIDLARTLAEGFREAKRSGDQQKMQETQSAVQQLGGAMEQQLASQQSAATAGAGVETNPATGAQQVAAGAANDQVVTGATAAPDAASAAVATDTGMSAAAGVDGKNAGAVASSQDSKATPAGSADDLLKKLNITQNPNGLSV